MLVQLSQCTDFFDSFFGCLLIFVSSSNPLTDLWSMLDIIVITKTLPRGDSSMAANDLRYLSSLKSTPKKELAKT